ncbi:class I SAM-dependent methyltransferase [Nocardioides litoris]|uniref:class I SAM-dependent methyltransferase n=1 Tax=Nocardioides litoris TaxID=1926648 RepID=UPI00111F01F4|nr:class I SAM-dependent methyltransferase [Nocardioides litoris]
MPEPDAVFAHPRLARLYNAFDGPRDDLDAYEALVADLGAGSVLDVGCGTGSLAVRLAAAGLDVVGVDPAAASLDVARAKPHADRVRWLHGDATTLPADLDGTRDLAVMTSNVAQVFTTDEAWTTALRGVRRTLGPGGCLVLETRVPARRAWERWTSSEADVRHVPGEGPVAMTRVVVSVALPLVTFTWTATFADATLVSTSTLRFRERDEVEASLAAVGLEVEEVRDAPDRPGQEWVFVATVTPGPRDGRPGAP